MAQQIAQNINCAEFHYEEFISQITNCKIVPCEPIECLECRGHLNKYSTLLNNDTVWKCDFCSNKKTIHEAKLSFIKDIMKYENVIYDTENAKEDYLNSN